MPGSQWHHVLVPLLLTTGVMLLLVCRPASWIGGTHSSKGSHQDIQTTQDSQQDITGRKLVSLRQTKGKRCLAPVSSVSFDGNDIATCSGESVDDCCVCCLATLGCNSYTLLNSTCYLKDASAHAKQCDDCVSGHIASESSGGRGSCGTKVHVDFGPDNSSATVGVVAVGAAAECCDVCAETLGCGAWTHFGGWCYMKSHWNGTAPCDQCTSGHAPLPKNGSHPLPPKWRVAGITFTGDHYCPNVTMGSPDSFQSMRHLRSTGATWVAIVVTAYQWNISSTEIFPLYNGSAVLDTTSNYWPFVTETMEQVRSAIRQARLLGLKVMLKPHVDLLRDEKPLGRFWRGDIGGCPANDWKPAPRGVVPFTSSQWDAWFASYENFFMPYAMMAHEEGLEMLSMNTELYCPNRQGAHWRRLIQKVRDIYSGTLTVAQIHGHEQEITWWDAVDIIGIDAYYDYEGNPSTLDELIYSWRRHPRSLARKLSAQYGGKPVIYAEVGFCSGWCSREHTPSLADYGWHAVQYEALLEAFAGEDYFLGAFWWNWNTDPGHFEHNDDCLTPQWKPAEDVLRRYWRATEPKPEISSQPAKCMGQGRCTC